jgi:hypothetical protein
MYVCIFYYSLKFYVFECIKYEGDVTISVFVSMCVVNSTLMMAKFGRNM